MDTSLFRSWKSPKKIACPVQVLAHAGQRTTQPPRRPVATLIGVPLYSNAAGVLPTVEALQAKGLAMGTVPAFMMSVVALSLPALIRRRVLKPRLLAVLVAVVGTGIMTVGFCSI